MFSGSSDSPMWKRGCSAFSSSTTSRPRCARIAAAVLPAGPPPMMRTSQSVGTHAGAIAAYTMPPLMEIACPVM